MAFKHCAASVLYTAEQPREVFLMTSPKWKGYIVPGGKKEEGETVLQALHREILEELGIPISNVLYVGSWHKPASQDFLDPSTEFLFEDHFAMAASRIIKPNAEIRSFDWFSIEDALKLPMPDGIQWLLEKYHIHLTETQNRPWLKGSQAVPHLDY